MRIAVVSDVHSNLHALDAVLADAGSVDAIWHLGDIVGYGPDPDAVVDRLPAHRGGGGRGGREDCFLMSGGGGGGGGARPGHVRDHTGLAARPARSTRGPGL